MVERKVKIKSFKRIADSRSVRAMDFYVIAENIVKIKINPQEGMGFSFKNHEMKYERDPLYVRFHPMPPEE